MAETDASGNLVWKESYRPYGDPVQPPNTDNKLWFTGKPYDKANGLTYMGARYYDPLIGRFMGVDPVGFKESNIHSFNRYAYANNNPNKYVDPDGRDAINLGVTLNPPSWLGKMIYGEKYIGQGVAGGVAISFPGFYGGEMDIGIYSEVHGGGTDYGTGRGTVDLGYNANSVKDLGGARC